MPVYILRQVVTYPLSPKLLERVDRVVGRDLKHAVEMVRAGEAARRDLERKGWTEWTDSLGRKVRIEVEGEEKA